MSGLVDDPRWIEHRDAYAAVRLGLRAPPRAHERYRESLRPYLLLLAESCEGRVTRKAMMRALFNEHLPLGAIAVAFQATEEELEYVQDAPPTVSQPVDEVERLQRMPYRLYLRTAHWQRVREEALRRAEARCLICNRGTGLEVHHRTYSRRGCERPADVVVLCADCHSRHHEKLRAA